MSTIKNTQSLLISSELEAKLKTAWPTLSVIAKASINNILSQANKYEKNALKRAIEKDPHNPLLFPQQLQHKIAEAKAKAFKQSESNDDLAADLKLKQDLTKA